MRSLTPALLLALLVVIAVISLWTPLRHPNIAERWFTLPNLLFLLPVPLLVVLFSLWLWRSVSVPTNSLHATPFVLTLGLIFLGFSGLGISIWPNIIPPGITLWQAAAPPQSQGFMLVGALVYYSDNPGLHLLELFTCSAGRCSMARGTTDERNR
ncbi:Cytochrome oxidase subunit II [Cedecea neteri]|uniref:Cytochrome oxidase subunit II n=1 Tax=Cedecea neteri TaxID=158822 RepID=A0A2X3JCH0_9ENTR|nr:Cytochrome oxidase subunit II [Cedecea neteri]